jgi:hypothetical protein
MQCPIFNKNTGLSNTLKGSKKGSRAGIAEGNLIEWKREEAIILAASPARRIGLKEVVVPLERLAGETSGNLPSTSGQSRPLTSFTPLEQSFREEDETMAAET